MKKVNKVSILFPCSLLLFTIGTAVTSTYSWFSTKRRVDAVFSGFQVVLPPSQEAELFWLSDNFNESLKCYSGYQEESLNDEQKKKFIRVEDSKTEASPTSSSKLYPNHRLTYALVFKPLRVGVFKFYLRSWSSTKSDAKKISEDKPIRLSWAISIFATCLEHKDGFSEAVGCFDGVSSSFQDSPAKSGDQSQKLTEFEISDSSKEYALYFSIFFQNDPSTYYRKRDDGFYEQDNDSFEQSNCYENLSFLAEKFELVPPEEDSI